MMAGEYGMTPSKTRFPGACNRGQRLCSFDVFELDAATGAQAVAGLLAPVQKPRIVLEPILEPVVFRLEADQRCPMQDR
jgi:hypothetical protein